MVHFIGQSVCPYYQEILKINKRIKILWLESSSFAGGIKQVSDSLLNNKTLEQLMLWHISDITDEDITHLSTQK